MQDCKKSKPVFGLRFGMQTRSEVVQDVISCEIGLDFESRLIITPNVDHIITLHNNPEYRKACEYAWKLTVDGFPVARFLRLVGVQIPERVTGADLFPEIMHALEPEKHRPCFLVATEHTRAFLVSWLSEHGFDSTNCLVAVPPFGFEKNEHISDQLVSELGRINATHLFMGVGAPKSEVWAYRNRSRLNNVCVLCFGAGIEFFSGNLVRAPEWMQKFGFEWVWRLCSEPRRLARRYLVNSWKFFYYATKEIVRQKKGLGV
ncbi:WecB/TagA/CpsF family glycosyltransferase [Uliginosibacterium sp. 31-12]|uniref:WecB/TagA/CpsF family glycosyltransferase n=1 Tax=Uliginosibacterium sp. 31-12 TaxID=3062781 RepID=UPI0026E47CB2|nr:WecB/TagA/CpsF family glycosyltransferase [Uliginosibacterium sp. 31-12]MDO6386059.1 WecB/TagA/CpsF family glycosyltransferase [Uliginosibacterium sp. 31-12]